ncbi:MAG: ABC transporter ATP-binding protein [Planctomycetota bacterium]
MREARVRARFGLPVFASDGPPAGPLEWADDAAKLIDDALSPGGIALITGPSGGGKSLLLRALIGRTSASVARPIAPRTRRSPVSMLRGDLDAALATLAAVGLGEARRLITPAGLLSEGERARLSLARAIFAAGPGSDIICDEFASTLDRLTARSLCRCVRRALPTRARLVCATAHDDIAPHLDPQIVAVVSLTSPPEIVFKRRGSHGAAGAAGGRSGVA